MTVLFADVSGFTAMSERLDPETVHRIMNDCFDGLGAAIAAEGGHIDKYIGDNVMALFGAPVAHADDPARAARAALMMQAFLAEFAERNRERAGVTFRMRIGIHCGLVLAGRVGASVRRDYSVMGDAVNLASRLESNARPGAILVSRDMMRRLRGQFAFGPALQLEVKGKAGAVEAAELLRELSEVERGADPAGELPFVGRAAEVEQLCTSWRHASSTAPATIVGPSGIGKTRLVRAAADAAGVSLLSVSARPATRRRPMALVRRIVQAVRAHVAPAAPRPDCLESFAASLAAVSDGLQPYLGALWYLSAADGLAVEPPDPDPRVLRQTLREGVARLLANLRRHDPGLVLFLDCYDDCDGASAELLRDLPAVGDPPPIVVVRREWDGAPPGDPVLRLGPLAPAEADALLDRLDHARALHPTLRGDVLRRAQGVPLYLHEILLKLVDAGVLRQTDDGWTCDPQASAAILPESLFGAMVARGDALEPPLRRLLLECSVQGIEFDAPVAAAVAAQRGGRRETVADGEAEVRRALAMLRDRTLVDVDTIRSDQWSFRQALLQAACYETLLLTERRRLHGETGHAIVRRAGGREAVAPELLAYHFETAEDWAEAAAANVRAGARAAELFANAEAADRYRRAIRFAGLGGDAAAGAATAARDAAARLHLRLGDYGEVERHARWLIDSGGGAADRATGLGHLAAVRFHAGRPDEAERHLRDAVACLDEKDASGAKVLARLH
ncbi:MAG: adenylate/guanylate cyclase domain-containing protein, partial [Alphaproteobacteria bacterium]